MKTNPNDPANPTTLWVDSGNNQLGDVKVTKAGLTKREHFAALAMAAYASADFVGNSGTAHSDIADWAVAQADALINALNNEEQP